MNSITVYFLFLILHTLAFMYQRTTLLIARKLKESNISADSVTNWQMLLTPTWLGILGWLLTFGVFGSYIYLWIEHGVLYALAGLIISIIIGSLMPIPFSYTLKLVNKHLKIAIYKAKSEEQKHIYKLLEDFVDKQKNYKTYF